MQKRNDPWENMNLKNFRKCRATIMLLASLLTCAGSVVNAQDGEVNARATAPHVYYEHGTGPVLSRNGSLPGERIEILLNAYQTEGRFTIMEFTFPVGSNSAPGHRHATHSETYLVLSGKMEWSVEGEVRILEAGDMIYVPPNSYHAARTLGDEPARTLFIFEPGGFELDVDRRNDLTEEQRNDPEFMQRFFESIDYHFDISRAQDIGGD